MADKSKYTSMSPEESVSNIIATASRHDVMELDNYMKYCKFDDVRPANVQDENGTTPLHAAILSCKVGSLNETTGTSSQARLEKAGLTTVFYLLSEGAIWNQLDKNDETPACVAYRLGLRDIYAKLVEAGTRAELLFGRMDMYDDIEVDEDGEGDDEEVLQLVEAGEAEMDVDSSALNDQVTSDNYLSSALSLTKDKLLDGQQNGVMMAWESGIMEKSATAILDKPGLRVLNIGAGMLIFDSFVQASENKPVSHHIVEAHPDVIKNMKAQSWDEKAGVVVHFGRWQDVLPELVAEDETFDAIYYDTFAESYDDFKEFFSEHVIDLLAPEGKWSFFNGMGADRQVSYDVYQEVVKYHLADADFEVEWFDIEVPKLDKEWENVKRKYWAIEKYRLPVCKFQK